MELWSGRYRFLLYALQQTSIARTTCLPGQSSNYSLNWGMARRRWQWRRELSRICRTA
jgi:hypothetical protein